MGSARPPWTTFLCPATPLPKALDDKDLKSDIADAHIIGIHSRTQLTEEIFESAEKLIAVRLFFCRYEPGRSGCGAAFRSSRALFEHALGGGTGDRRNYNTEHGRSSRVRRPPIRAAGRSPRLVAAKSVGTRSVLSATAIPARNSARLPKAWAWWCATSISLRSAAPGQFGVAGFAR